MNPNVHWPDETLPVQIYCAPGVLTGLEMTAADGLLAIPRTGLGVGGLLLGRRGNGRIEILATAEISCSHALGPAFALTPDEIAASSEFAADGSELVGWYCSKPSGSKVHSPSANEHDHALFDALCPEPWQLMLLIRPGIGKTTMGVFGLRASGDFGHPFLMGTPKELAWQELAAFQASEPSSPPAELEEDPAEVKAEPAEVKAELAELKAEPAPPVIPIPMARSGTLFGASGATSRGKRRWRLRLLIVAMVLALLSAAALFTAGIGYHIRRLP
jgi:hypothetical protein